MMVMNERRVWSGAVDSMSGISSTVNIQMKQNQPSAEQVIIIVILKRNSDQYKSLYQFLQDDKLK